MLMNMATLRSLIHVHSAFLILCAVLFVLGVVISILGFATNNSFFLGAGAAFIGSIFGQFILRIVRALRERKDQN